MNKPNINDQKLHTVRCSKAFGTTPKTESNWIKLRSKFQHNFDVSMATIPNHQFKPLLVAFKSVYTSMAKLGLQGQLPLSSKKLTIPLSERDACVERYNDM